MLTKQDQYSIAMGIIQTYKNDLPSPIKAKGMSKQFDMMFNYERFSSYTRSRFMLVCIFLVYKNDITNISEFITISRNFSELQKEYETFIEDIKFYKMKMEKDINYLYKRGNLNDFFIEALNDYQNGNIHFFSLYFVVLLGKHQHIMEQRIYRRHWKQMKFLMKFFSFDIEFIKLLINPKLGN